MAYIRSSDGAVYEPISSTISEPAHTVLTMVAEHLNMSRAAIVEAAVLEYLSEWTKEQLPAMRAVNRGR